MAKNKIIPKFKIYNTHSPVDCNIYIDQIFKYLFQAVFSTFALHFSDITYILFS